MAALAVPANGHSEVKSPFRKREPSDDRPGDDNVKKKKHRLSESGLCPSLPGEQHKTSSRDQSWNVASLSFSSLPGGPYSQSKHATGLKTKLKKIKKEGELNVFIVVSSFCSFFNEIRADILLPGLNLAQLVVNSMAKRTHASILQLNILIVAISNLSKNYLRFSPPNRDMTPGMEATIVYLVPISTREIIIRRKKFKEG